VVKPFAGCIGPLDNDLGAFLWKGLEAWLDLAKGTFASVASIVAHARVPLSGLRSLPEACDPGDCDAQARAQRFSYKRVSQADVSAHKGSRAGASSWLYGPAGRSWSKCCVRIC
jgi:hypothetical protein